MKKNRTSRPSAFREQKGNTKTEQLSTITDDELRKLYKAYELKEEAYRITKDELYNSITIDLSTFEKLLCTIGLLSDEIKRLKESE